MSYRHRSHYHDRMFEGEEFVYLALVAIYVIVEIIHFRKTGRFISRRTNFWTSLIGVNVTPEPEDDANTYDYRPSPTNPEAYVKPKPNDPTVGLEESFRLNQKFTVGKFRGGITRKMRTTDDLAHMRILCVFLVNIPEGDALTFKITVSKEDWAEAKDAKGPKTLSRLCYWGIPDEELSDRFKKKDGFIQLRRLIRVAGPCEIICSKGRFLVISLEGIETTRALISFRKHATELFRCYAQVAQMKVPSWRSEDVSYDWWQDKQLSEEADEETSDEEGGEE